MLLNDSKCGNYGDDDDNDGEGDEYIAEIIVKPPDKLISISIYKSKHRKSVKNESNHYKYEHKTLGVMRMSFNLPGRFLKKNSRIHPKRPKINHEHYRRPDYQYKLSAWEPLRLSEASGKPLESSEIMTSTRQKINPIKNLKEFPNGHYVTDKERAHLLHGMKKKWDELMRQFQALPFLTDTPPKAKRKSKMEENLKQLEKDIDDIERHPCIYVYDNMMKS